MTEAMRQEVAGAIQEAIKQAGANGGQTLVAVILILLVFAMAIGLGYIHWTKVVIPDRDAAREITAKLAATVERTNDMVGDLRGNSFESNGGVRQIKHCLGSLIDFGEEVARKTGVDTTNLGEARGSLGYSHSYPDSNPR